VQQERLDVGPEIGDQKRRLVRHEAADEMHVAREPVELGDGDRARLSVAAGASQCGGELRAAIKGVSAFARLDLGELADDLKPLRLCDPSLQPHAGRQCPVQTCPSREC